MKIATVIGARPQVIKISNALDNFKYPKNIKNIYGNSNAAKLIMESILKL